MCAEQARQLFLRGPLDERPVPLSEEHRQRMLKSEDVAAAVLFVATLPPHVSVPELIIKPVTQLFL